ncbi:MAG: ribose-phosphate diphosphokinase [Euryarchaeota archaeon]|nr:ribose-phosphate diphosphokinase [Euryarchaeota archaeon]
MQIMTAISSPILTYRISKELNLEILPVERKKFPDGEIYIRLLEKPDDEVVLVQNTYPNDGLVAALLAMQALKSEGAKEITLVIPYFGYGRQDKKFLEGEPVSAEAIAKALSRYADKVVLVDPHKDYIADFFDVEAKVVHAYEALVEMLYRVDVDIVLAPDVGALERAKNVAKSLGVDWDYLEKTRISGEEVEIKPKDMDVEDKNVALVDDIISTGGTLIEASKALKAQGAKSVVAACVHGLFTKFAIHRILESPIDDVGVTDTIEGPLSVASAASTIARALK